MIVQDRLIPAWSKAFPSKASAASQAPARSPAAAFNPIIEMDQPSFSHTLSPAWKSNSESGKNLIYALTIAVPLVERQQRARKGRRVADLSIRS